MCLPFRTFRSRLSLLALAISTSGLVCLAQEVPQSSKHVTAQDIVDQILAFVYSLAHLIGQGVVKLIATIIPSLEFPGELVDPIGVLAILTIFLAAAAIAKKLVWIIVVAGWALILVRLIMVIIQSYL